MGGPWNGQSEVQIDYGRKGADLNWTWMKRRFDSLLSDVRFICHLCVKRKDFGLFYLRNCIFFFSQYVQKETCLWRFIQRHLLQPSPKSLFYILLEERASDQCSCQTRAASLYLQTAVQSNLFSLKRDSSLSPRITFFSTDTTFLVQIFVVTGGGILVTLVIFWLLLQRHPEFDVYGFDFVTTIEWIVMTFAADFHVPHRTGRNHLHVPMTFHVMPSWDHFFDSSFSCVSTSFLLN